MSESPHGREVLSNVAHRLLQQQLITVRARLDRQVSQLMRLNQVSNDLLGHPDGRPVATAFAEVIVDVLDLAVAAVWILPHDPDEPDRFGSCGLPCAQCDGSTHGDALADALRRRGITSAVRLDSLDVEVLPDAALLDALVCPCIGRDGTITGVVLAGNTPATAGMGEPVTDDTAELLAVLAEKCAAHLDNQADRRLIEEQLEQLRESEERLGLVLRGTNDGWWDWDLRHGTCFLSARWLQMAGRDGEIAEVQTRFWHDRVHPDDRPSFEHRLERAFASGDDSVETELRLRRDDHTYLPVLVRGSITRDSTGTPVRFAGSILDLTERKRHEAHIHRLAFYDPLTDLPNRRLLGDRLQQALLNSDRTGQVTAVVMLDLDRFKTLNDTHGHAAGDQLLRAVGRRLTGLVRHSDTVARLSGDEFVVLLDNLGCDLQAAVDAVQHIADNILHALNEPYVLDVGVLHHSASIGVAVADEPRLTVETLLKHADVALYQAKADGRNGVRLFHPSMQVRVDTRSAMEAQLREGLAHDEFRLVYQAQVDEVGTIIGAEALLRWNPTGRDPVSPAEFIPVAEESGVIHPLGQWVLDGVCTQLAAWQHRMPPGFRVAVNLSAPEFLHPDFAERVIDTLHRTGAPGSSLRLEITEATVLTDLAFAADRMDVLRAHDIEFSLDDFGTGYSSLTYLRRLPVDEVKIDRSYVRRLLEDPHDAAIVRAVLALCDALDLRVVAEGVEMEAEWRRLVDDGCHYFQGFLFGRPIAAPDDPAGLAATGSAPLAAPAN